MTSIYIDQSRTIWWDEQQFFVVPIPGGAAGAGRSRAQRSQLQPFNSSDLPEFKYDSLPKLKQRIRLLQLQSGTTYGPEIHCELIEADYDNDFHIPTKVSESQKAEEERKQRELDTMEEEQQRQMEEAEMGKKRKEEEERTEERQREKEKKEKMGPEERKVYEKTKEEEEAKERGERFDKVSENAISYEALSWCWGTDAAEYALTIKHKGKKYKKRVRRELALALKYLRLQDQKRTLWIDAICINQDDHEERNQQVQMMSRVYTRAKEVCIWLGEDSDESKTAIDFIHHEIMQLKNFDTLCSDKKYTGKWRALMMLMQREWFSRRWVVQEIALASNARIYCGPDSISWKELAVAVELFVEVETATHRLSEIMKKDEKFLHVPGWFEHVSELGASLLVQATGRVFRAQRTPLHENPSNPSRTQELRKQAILREGTIDPLDRRSLLSLEYLVSTLFIFKASEPRDVVYSLLAIARDAAPFAKSAYRDGDQSLLIMSVMESFLEEKPFVVDYGRPYSDVCRDFVEFIIRRKNKWDPVQALDILCRPWALEPPTGKSIRLPPPTPERSAKGPRLIPQRGKRPWKTRPMKIVRDGTPEQQQTPVQGQQQQQPAQSPDQTPGQGLGQDRQFSPYNIRRKYEPDRDGDESEKELEVYWKEVAEKDHLTDFQEESAATPSAAAPSTAAPSTAAFDWRKHPDGWEDILWHFPNVKQKGNGSNGNKDVSTTAKNDPLPAWVARASEAPFSLYHHPGMHIHKAGRSNADPLVGQPEDGHRNYSAAQTNPVDLDTLKFRKRQKCGHYSLYVRGFEIDTVETVLDASQGGNIPRSWLDLGDWDCHNNYEEDPPDTFWRTLVADRGRDNRNPPYYYATACKESVQKGGIASGRVNTADLINNERNSIVAEFCRRVQAVIWGRRLFKTKHGKLGLARSVQRGDKVCILYGCTVPVILSKRNKATAEKTAEDVVKEEQFDDSVEALKASFQRTERILEGKARYARKRKEMGTDYEKEIRAAQKDCKDRSGAAASTKGLPRYTEKPLEDPKVYYEFKGETYVHGMMDGEALRMKFYEKIADVLFELR